jgi:hypothetical protein
MRATVPAKSGAEALVPITPMGLPAKISTSLLSWGMHAGVDSMFGHPWHDRAIPPGHPPMWSAMSGTLRPPPTPIARWNLGAGKTLLIPPPDPQ